MATFEKAIGYILDNEGADSDDAADHGGRTRFGITHAEAKRHGLRVETLTLDQAKAIYLTDYWRFDDIADQRIATKLLDLCVNLGPATGIKLAQGVIGVRADGVIGPATVKVINAYSSGGADAGAVFLLRLALAACQRYATIVANDHSQVVFLRGWIERAAKLPK